MNTELETPGPNWKPLGLNWKLRGPNWKLRGPNWKLSQTQVMCFMAALTGRASPKSRFSTIVLHVTRNYPVVVRDYCAGTASLCTDPNSQITIEIHNLQSNFTTYSAGLPYRTALESCCNRCGKHDSSRIVLPPLWQAVFLPQAERPAIDEKLVISFPGGPL